jgi:phosphatidylserine decarboxylase
MKLHKEGYGMLAGVFIVLLAINVPLILFSNLMWLNVILGFISLVFFALILQFFRYPLRPLPTCDEQSVIAPADGTVVAIEEVEEPEFFKDKRIQVSIFMSPLNVHVNRYPIHGQVCYIKYHPGLYLCAWHPKSSTENERNTLVVESRNGTKVLMRQIAGALARRIKCYASEGDTAVAGGDMGFIKFGSRVDVFLPLNAKVHVQLNQKVKGRITVIGQL